MQYKQEKDVGNKKEEKNGRPDPAKMKELMNTLLGPVGCNELTIFAAGAARENGE